MAIIGVTGYKGRLGSELVRRGCVPLEADVTDFGELEEALLAASPDVVVHCAALTDVDACEHAPILAARVNAGGTYLLGQVFRGPIVYVSTDYIFDGRLGPYDERGTPNPLGIYGWSKLGGELALKARGNPADLIVRTTILYDDRSPNFVTKVLAVLELGRQVAAPWELCGSPTYVPHLAEAILAAVEKGIGGVVNIAGSDVLSRYEFGRLIARRWGLNPELIVPGPVNGSAPRPLRAGLRVDKALDLDLPVYSIVQGLEEMQRAMETVAAG
jgi:dTDP-4-dehydrorhamnose reductase